MLMPLKKMMSSRMTTSTIVFIYILHQLSFALVQSENHFKPVALHVDHRHVVIDNGKIQLKLTNPDGFVSGISYKGIDNILEKKNKEDDRGYWDVVWGGEGSTRKTERVYATRFKKICASKDKVEVSFTRKWNSSSNGPPLIIDKRYIVLRGSSGFYSYAIYEHPVGWPAFNLGQTRLVFKLSNQMFHYMAIGKNKQRLMPSLKDRTHERSEELAYPEAVHLTNPINPDMKGEVDDKYQYSSNNNDSRVHGWVCMKPHIGFWLITPSDEFRSGGPLKQELTSHVGPITLATFITAHYAGKHTPPTFQTEEYWKKVFGPVFVYINSGNSNSHPQLLWSDANRQAQAEINSWPYAFLASKDFQKQEERGSISGRFVIHDKFNSKGQIIGDGAFVGLAAPGEPGSWQTESKGYQFWTKTDANGNFSIKNVRTGEYSLYAWAPGFIGDFKAKLTIIIEPGTQLNLGELMFEPPRHGPTMWEIGIPDRSAAEFFIPEPNPNYINKLYLTNYNERYRQYGLWERYSEMYPEGDLNFTLGVSDYSKDWFYAHVTRKIAEGSYGATTWQIRFQLDNVVPDQMYKLRVALASSTYAELQVRFNDPNVQRPHFTTGLVGQDNAIARHGIHGIYWLFNIDVESIWLQEGENIIYLTQSRCGSSFQGLMYDYIRFEGPPKVSVP